MFKIILEVRGLRLTVWVPVSVIIFIIIMAN